MNNVMNVAASGLRAAQVRLDNAAHNIANAQTEGFRRGEVRAEALADGGVRAWIDKRPEAGADLAADLVEQRVAANAFAANLRVLQRADEALGSLGRLLDTRA